MAIALTSSWESHCFLIISGVFESLGERLCSSRGSSDTKGVDHTMKWPSFDPKVKSIFVVVVVMKEKLKRHLHPSIKAPIYIKDIKLIPIEFKDCGHLRKFLWLSESRLPYLREMGKTIEIS